MYKLTPITTMTDNTLILLTREVINHTVGNEMFLKKLAATKNLAVTKKFMGSEYCIEFNTRGEGSFRKVEITGYKRVKKIIKKNIVLHQSQATVDVMTNVNTLIDFEYGPAYYEGLMKALHNEIMLMRYAQAVDRTVGISEEVAKNVETTINTMGWEEGKRLSEEAFKKLFHPYKPEIDTREKQ